jgi:hypothetical protein
LNENGIVENHAAATGEIHTLPATNITSSSAALHFSLKVNQDLLNVIYFEIIGIDNKKVGDYTSDVADGYYNLTGLSDNTTYTYRVRGFASSTTAGDMMTELPAAEWRTFTTGVQGTTPPGGIDIPGIAQAIGNGLFGGSKEAGGIFLSLCIMMMVIFPLAYIGMPPFGSIALIIMMIGMFTAVTWLPMWITLVVGLGFSLLVAKMAAVI